MHTQGKKGRTGRWQGQRVGAGKHRRQERAAGSCEVTCRWCTASLAGAPCPTPTIHSRSPVLNIFDIWRFLCNARFLRAAGPPAFGLALPASRTTPVALVRHWGQTMPGGQQASQPRVPIWAMPSRTSCSVPPRSTGSGTVLIGLFSMARAIAHRGRLTTNLKSNRNQENNMPVRA